MEDLARFLNSPLGLLLVGSIVSGLIVQFIVSRWQRQNWIFQQQFTDRQTRLNKKLEAQYKLLEAINLAVAKISTHSQNVVVGHMKQFPQKQMTAIIEAYNVAVDDWELDARVIRIQLQVHFGADALVNQWDTIKKLRDELDVAIYQTDTGETTLDECLQRISALSAATEELSRIMYDQISTREKQVEN